MLDNLILYFILMYFADHMDCFPANFIFTALYVILFIADFMTLVKSFMMMLIYNSRQHAIIRLEAMF